MKGLLLKDWYILRNKGKMYFAIIPIYLLIGLISSNNYFFLFFTAVFVAMLPRTLAAYDEHARWNCYTAALPLSKRQLVFSRYLILLIILVCTLVLMAAVSLFGGILLKNAQFAFGGSLPAGMSIMTSLTLLYSSFSMPLLYRFGVERGRVVQTALMLLFMVAAGALSAIFAVPEASPLFELFPLLLLPGSIVLFIASYLLSVKWYRYTNDA